MTKGGFVRLRGVLVYIFFICAGIFMIFPAKAVEPLSFEISINDRIKQRIYNFLKYDLASHSAKESSLKIMETDLNGDGLSEFIIKTPFCQNKTSLCTYKILAEKNARLIELADINARNIALGNDHTNGVRNILAFDSPMNDFEHHVYIWEPRSARYMMKEQ